MPVTRLPAFLAECAEVWIFSPAKYTIHFALHIWSTTRVNTVTASPRTSYRLSGWPKVLPHAKYEKPKSSSYAVVSNLRGAMKISRADSDLVRTNILVALVFKELGILGFFLGLVSFCHK